MKKTTLITLTLLFTSLFVISQESTKKSIDNFKKNTQANISINKNLNIPSFIKFPNNKPLVLNGNTIKNKVDNFLIANKNMYAIKNVSESFNSGIIKTDNYGLKHYIVQQYYKGVPIYDSELRFHFNKNEELNSINGNIIPDINLDIMPTLTKEEANLKALNLVKEQNINNSGAPLKIINNTLYVFPKGLAQGFVTSKYLTYRIEVRNDLDVREYLFIDAHSGKLIEQFTGMAHALFRELYEVDYSTKKYTEGGSIFFLNQWQKNEVETAGHTYYLFYNAFGIDSYDNAGAKMITINNNPDINCPNANWNGVTTNYCTGTASDDVVAHEWGHAYTEYTCDLIYAYEAGALNESLSDIWGETVDILNNYEDVGENLALRTGCNSSDRWKMGEDASAFGGAIRDMWDPNCIGADPGKVTDANYTCDITLSDNGGVHSNSGITNHAYALMVDGGTYNGQTVAGLGFTKAVHIIWRAQSQYLTQTSGYAEFADAVEAACNDLIGINLQGLSTTSTPAGLSGQIITISDYNEVVKALLAVELRLEKDCAYTTILAANDPICEAAGTNPIFQEDWESGITNGWTVSQLPTNAGTWESREWIIETSLPKQRAGQGVYAPNPVNGDCDTDLQNGIIRLESPTIVIPNYTTGNFELAFDHNIASEVNYDGGNVKYSIDGGAWTVIPAVAFIANGYNVTLNNTNNDNPMMGEDAFSGVDQGSFTSSSWGQTVINLTELGVTANSSLKLRWEFGSDGCNGIDGWYLDDIVIYNCSEALSANDFNFLNNNIHIYPNPASGIFNIEMKSITDFQFDIYDITGKVIMSKIDVLKNNFNLDLSNYSKGIYFIKLKSDSGSITKKLIIK
ncbi:MAG: M4 family metallopeptidase [Flavobacteriaceae bacterium]|nr:M4 family metallopeptidase [Flavobacteriaceae bacterium]